MMIVVFEFLSSMTDRRVKGVAKGVEEVRDGV
jgi:hypothetical protein